jgi:thiol-disulfide isomerase/thioredoxin
MRYFFYLLILLFPVSNCIAQNTGNFVVTARMQEKFDNDTLFIRDSIHLPEAVFLLNFHCSSLPIDFVRYHANRIPASLRHTKEAVELFDMIKEDSLLPVNSNMKDFEILDLEGSRTWFSKVKSPSKLLLVDFWASWCGPCRDNAPALQELFERYSKTGLGIISVSLDDDVTKWRAAIQQDGMQLWAHVRPLAENSVSDLLGISFIPRYVLMTSEGKVLGKFNGRWKGLEDLHAAIKKHLQVKGTD